MNKKQVYVCIDKSKRAFTLLEMLLVIAIIAILAGIVIIAINPGRQLARARNAQRSSNLRAIHLAIQQYYIDNQSWPSTTMPSELTEICDADGQPSGCLDLSDLVPTYLSAIPTDPQATVGTNYEIAINPTSLMPELTAPSSTEYELEPVQFGTTTALAVNDVETETELSFPTDGLVSYWSMDSMSGTTVFDTFGSNDGTADGSPLFDAAYGKQLDGVDLNGSNQYIYNTSPNNMPNATDISVSFWVNADNLGYVEFEDYNPRAIVHASETYYMEDTSFYVRLLSKKVHYLYRNSADTAYNSFGTVNDVLTENSWYHVVVTHNGSSVSMFINGEPVPVETRTGSATDVQSKTTNNISIGIPTGAIIGSGVTRYFDGSLDEIAIWNRALTPDEASEIYNNGTGLYYTP